MKIYSLSWFVLLVLTSTCFSENANSQEWSDQGRPRQGFMIARSFQRLRHDVASKREVLGLLNNDVGRIPIAVTFHRAKLFVPNPSAFSDQQRDLIEVQLEGNVQGRDQIIRPVIFDVEIYDDSLFGRERSSDFQVLSGWEFIRAFDESESFTFLGGKVSTAREPAFSTIMNSDGARPIHVHVSWRQFAFHFSDSRTLVIDEIVDSIRAGLRRFSDDELSQNAAQVRDLQNIRAPQLKGVYRIWWAISARLKSNSSSPVQSLDPASTAQRCGGEEATVASSQ